MAPSVALYVATCPSDVPVDICTKAATSIYTLLMKHPAEAIAKFRSSFELYHARDIEPFAGPDTTVEQLGSSFAFWIDALRHICNTMSKSNNLEMRRWDAAADAGLLDIYLDIILWSRFFSQCHRFINDVFIGLAFLGEHLPDEEQEILLRSRAAELWESIWEHRNDVEWWSWDALTGGDVEGADNVGQKHAESAILPLLDLYLAWCKSTALTSTYIPHIILYFMATYDGPIGDLLRLGLKDIVKCLLSEFNTSGTGDAGRDKIDLLLQEAVIDTVGINVLFGRLSGVLSHKPTVNLDLFTLCIGLLGVLCSGRNVDTMPYFIQHDIMALFVACTMESRLEDGSTLFTQCPNALWVFNIVTMHYVATKTVVAQGNDAVAFLAACLDTVVTVRRPFSPPLPAEYESIVWHCTAQYHLAAKKIKETTDPEQSAASFLQDLQTGARAFWWPTLARMRQAKPRGHDGWTFLSDTWRDFGILLGLDAKQERQRHEEAARLACSWRNCPLRGRPAAHDKPASKKCAGCGEKKYCSRDCQMRDWKQGGHKAQCKRLKN